MMMIIRGLFWQTLFGLVLIWSAAVPGALHACETKLSHMSRVVDIIDGHTVRLDDGAAVRLMGALAPEPPL